MNNVETNRNPDDVAGMVDPSSLTAEQLADVIEIPVINDGIPAKGYYHKGSSTIDEGKKYKFLNFILEILRPLPKETKEDVFLALTCLFTLVYDGIESMIQNPEKEVVEFQPIQLVETIYPEERFDEIMELLVDGWNRCSADGESMECWVSNKENVMAFGTQEALSRKYGTHPALNGFEVLPIQ